jgi:SAM-dependent methyltransferase
MDKNYIISKVRELKPWYQTITLDGLKTTHKSLSGEYFWPEIKNFLPDNLEGKRILDLGCNAGYYSIQSALLGCKEVIGIELNNRFYNQALFIKEYYEDKYNKKFDNIKYLSQNISDLNFDELGKFDYILAIAILYHIGKHRFGKYTPKTMKEQERMIGILTSVSPKVIVRSRSKSKNSMQHYDEIFLKFGFKNLANVINKSGLRTLILYGKDDGQN